MTNQIAIHLNELHPAQQRIADCKARFRVLVCGRRFGKTLLASDELINRALDGLQVSYFAPTHKMASEVWRDLKHTLYPVIANKSEQERRIELTTHGTISLWSLENADSARGRSYDFIVVDEAALLPSADIWQQVLRPMLADTQGQALFLSTPKGHNWFYNLYTLGIDSTYTDWESFHHSTADNPLILASEIESARLELPERTFQQEYLAEFVEDAGAVFRNVDLVSTLQPREPYAGQFVFGVDWARSEDYTVISIFDVETNEQVYLDRFNRVSWEIQKDRLVNLYNLWKPYKILAESNSIGEVIIEDLRRMGLSVDPFQTTAQSKTPLIDGLAIALERMLCRLLDDVVQKSELKAYWVERMPSGTYRYGAPPSGHDDTVIATALAVKAMFESRLLIDLIEVVW